MRNNMTNGRLMLTVDVPVEVESVAEVVAEADVVPVLEPVPVLDVPVAVEESVESEPVGSLSAPTTGLKMLARTLPSELVVARFLIMRLSPAWSRGV